MIPTLPDRLPCLIQREFDGLVPASLSKELRLQGLEPRQALPAMDRCAAPI